MSLSLRLNTIHVIKKNSIDFFKISETARNERYKGNRPAFSRPVVFINVVRKNPSVKNFLQSVLFMDAVL